MKTNKSAIESMKENSIFTNVGRTPDDDVWWEGLSDNAPEGLRTWKGEIYGPNSGPAAQPNARFTAPLTQCPTLDPSWNDSEGVPISAIIFGGRRQTMVPLVREASSWQQGVFFGASMTSETTAAAKGAVGNVRNDPFAMLPFCGYNMGDYFAHWLSMGQGAFKLPKIFYVNWFLKDANGKFVWPGFGENIRVLAWIFNRLDNQARARKTPIGLFPEEGSMELPAGVSYSALFPMNVPEWIAESQALLTYFARFKDRLPKAISDEVALLVKSLASS
jgi:phosphoenolpyruvate carboxykinase (GTP)